MKTKFIAIIAILLIISLGNYFMFISKGNIRPVEFLSIMVIGALTLILLTQLFNLFSKKKN